jgi:PKD repeat protein
MIKFTKKGRLGNYNNSLIILILCLIYFDLNIISLHAQTITMVRYFDTWQANPQIIKSTDPAGIAYHSPSGHLYIADSEINELPVFTGYNIFEVSTLGDAVFQEIASGNQEPTGITYSEYDGYFYVSNDNANTITRYDNNFNIVAEIKTTADDTTAKDAEGITSDPSTGFLYITDGSSGGRQVLIYNANLEFQNKFSVSAAIPGVDPEGIAFNPDNDHLFIVDGGSNEIYEFTTSGIHLHRYDISGFLPTPNAAQGLTFAPTSDQDDDPNNLALYIADGILDNNPHPEERDGRIYETVIKVADFVGTPRIVGVKSVVAFTNLSAVDITSYNWDFGDSTTSTLRDPSHTYNAEGVYTVSLTGTGPLGTHTETKTDYIRVIPTAFKLHSNYPNPFNATTTIGFSLPQNEYVTLKIYNILGEEVATLVSERLAAGQYKYVWPARSSGGDASNLASGVYLCRIQAGDFVKVEKMVLMK